MSNKSYTVAVDLGESEVIAVAGTKDQDGVLRIAAISRRPNQGLRAGRIENIAQINDALSGAIADIEATLGVEIQQAYGGISGEFVRCAHHTETIMIEEPNSGVTQSDVAALHKLMREVAAPENDTIMESNHQNYIVDGKQEIKNPIGTFGRTLSSRFHFTLCDKESLKRLNLAFMQAGIMLKQCFPNGKLMAEAVLSSDEKEGGVVAIDLGKGITNMAIYYRGAARYMISIPMGGSAIDHDLRSLMVHERNVERLKIIHGSAVALMSSKGSINIAGRTAREKHSIAIHNIAIAIEERIKDIITFIHREIHDAGYDGRLPYGIVLTGGGAQIPHIDELFRRELGFEVRIASLDAEEMLDVDFGGVAPTPAFATVVGLLRRGIDVDQRGIGSPCIAAVEETEEEPQEETSNEELPDSAEEQSNTTAEQSTPKKTITQTKLDLEIEEEEEEEYDEVDDEEDEEEEEEIEKKKSKNRGKSSHKDNKRERDKSGKDKGDKGEKKRSSISGFFKNLSDTVNNLFNSSGDTEL